MASKNPLADSAGVPWEGRQFEANGWRGDDGSLDAVLGKVLQDLAERRSTVTALMASLPGKRLLVPLVANLGEAEVGPHGQLVEKSAELAIVAVATPDGATAIPAFTDVDSMRAWRAEARPVPVSVEKLALAAASEGHTRIILNPATLAVAIRRHQLRALATGTEWTPPARDAEVQQALEGLLKNYPQVASHQLEDADPFGRLATAEVILTLGLIPDLSPAEIEQLLQSVAVDIQASILMTRIDSYGFKLVSAPGR